MELVTIDRGEWLGMSTEDRWALVHHYDGVIAEDAPLFQQSIQERAEEFYRLFDNWLRNGQITYYALRERARIVCALRLHCETDPHTLLLEALYTAPVERNRGLARQLVTRVRQLHPGRVIRADVHLGNVPSRSVMRSCGFEEGERGAQESTWRAGGESEPHG